LIPDIYSRDVLHHEVTSNQALVQELRHALNTEVSDKKQNILISPALFGVTKGTDTRRGLDNITQVYGIWLDNDGGELTPDDLRGIFPGLWMACFSTYSGGNRYRVFIPTSQPMTVEADAAVKRMIFDQLHQAGYHDATAGMGKRHGFDTSKLTASSLFFLPCRQPGADVFFIEYPGEELDPQAWIARPTMTGLFDEPEPIILPSAPDPHTRSQLSPQRTGKLEPIRVQLNPATDIRRRADEATQVYLETPKGAGLRNAAFFKLGATLQRLGLCPAEVGRHLHATADNSDRRKQVKSIIRTLRKKLGRTGSPRAAADRPARPHT
jgi:hypothetical protein